MKATTTRRLYRWHLWSGLLGGLNIFILSLTGAILVFGHELHEVLGPKIPVHIKTDVPASYYQIPLQNIVEKMQSTKPQARPAILGIPSLREFNEDPEHFLFFFELQDHPEAAVSPDNSRASGPYKYFFDPARAVFAPESQKIDILEWIWYLHANLFLGLGGQVYLGIIGLTFLFSTVTGCIIYGPFMKGLLFAALRRGSNWRLWLADLHKLVGIATLAFNLLMALTGVLLTLGQFLINIYSYSIISNLESATVLDGADYAPIDQVVATARQALPDKHVRWIMYPGQLQGAHHYAAIAYEDRDFFNRIPYVALIQAYDGSLVETVELPWFITMIYVAQPLHFGDFGGLGLRLIYAFFGLTSGLLAISGFCIYFIKRRRTGNEEHQ